MLNHDNTPFKIGFTRMFGLDRNSVVKEATYRGKCLGQIVECTVMVGKAPFGDTKEFAIDVISTTSVRLDRSRMFMGGWCSNSYIDEAEFMVLCVDNFVKEYGLTLDVVYNNWPNFNAGVHKWNDEDETRDLHWELKDYFKGNLPKKKKKIKMRECMDGTLSWY